MSPSPVREPRRPPQASRWSPIAEQAYASWVARVNPAAAWRAASVGIDVAEARKGLDLVALDVDRRVVVSRGRLSVAEAVSLALELRPTLVCIDSPSGWSTSGRSRAAERRLASVGIRSFRTGRDPGDHPFYRWMRVGFSIFAGLSGAFPLYRGGAVTGTAAEIFPHGPRVSYRTKRVMRPSA